MEINITPILSQMFLIKAQLDCIEEHFIHAMNDEEKKRYKESFGKHFKENVKEFCKQFPDSADVSPYWQNLLNQGI